MVDEKYDLYNIYMINIFLKNHNVEEMIGNRKKLSKNDKLYKELIKILNDIENNTLKNDLKIK